MNISCVYDIRILEHFQFFLFGISLNPQGFGVGRQKTCFSPFKTIETKT